MRRAAFASFVGGLRPYRHTSAGTMEAEVPREADERQLAVLFRVLPARFRR